MTRNLKRITCLLFVIFSCLCLSSCLPSNWSSSNPELVPQEPSDEDQSIKDEYECITIEEAIKLATEAGTSGTSESYYIYGTIKEVSNSLYGEMTIYDETGELYVYGVYSADGSTRYDALEEKPIKGDEVVLYGMLKLYNDTPELDRGYLQAFKHVEVEVDDSLYTEYSVSEARNLEKDEKVKLTGVVAQITYAFGQVPNGFYLVDETGSIYVYGTEITGNVKVGNTVTIIGEKTYYVLESEQSNAEKHGYKGCCQIQNATLVENDKKVTEFAKTWIEETTVKEIMNTPVTENITTNIYKVNALVKKVESPGFVNYYIDDLDGITGSYVYTACSGADFAWLDEFDGKICTVYLSPINAKSTSSDCFYRFIPVLVEYENYEFDYANTPAFALEYYAKDQFLTEYLSNPTLEVVTTAANEVLNFEGVTFTYTSNNEEVVYFEEVEGKVVFNTANPGKAVVTIKAEYAEYSASINLEIEVKEPVVYETITVNEAIESIDGTEVTVKGIVLSSLVNQTGFYLIDETGVIAVTSTADEVSVLTPGDEVIIKGIKSHKVKDGYEGAGQINIYNATVLLNNYGKHEIPTNNYDYSKTLADLYALDHMEDHTTQIYVVEAVVDYVETNFYTSIQLKSTDGATKLGLYCSGAGQYSFLFPYAGQTVTLEIAMCNWNSKEYYRGCVVAVIVDGERVVNTLNFN